MSLPTFSSVIELLFNRLKLKSPNTKIIGALALSLMFGILSVIKVLNSSQKDWNEFFG
jgi:hypothetical protein